MADRTGIEWTDCTLNPIRARNRATGKVGWHCEHVSPACQFCYAERRNRWIGTGLFYRPGHLDDVEIFLDEKMLLQPFSWRRPRKIFITSTTDLFGAWVTDEMLDCIFAMMALNTRHTFQLLTKRAERARSYMQVWFERLAAIDPVIDHPAGRERFSKLVDWTILPQVLPNVWLGTTCEDQERANQNIPILLTTPAALHFVSCEPLLGPIDLAHIPMSKPDFNSVFRTIDALTGRRGHGGMFGYTETCDPIQAHLGWVITGGESGSHARPMHPDWERKIRDDCLVTGVPFFKKQQGEWAVIYDRDVDDPDWRQCCALQHQTPRGRWLNLAGGTGFHGNRVVRVDRVGKERAGCLLDGIEHKEFPAC